MSVVRGCAEWRCSMKIVERRCVRSGGIPFWSGWRLHTGVGTVELCHGTLEMMFDIPEKVRVIGLSLHDSPSANRVEMGVVRTGRLKFPRIVSKEYGITFSAELLDSLLKPLASKTVHLQCEYEI